MTFAEDVTGEEAKAADEARVTPDEKDGSARCETVKKVATELTKPPEKYQATAATELCGLPDRCCAPEKCCGGRTPILSAEKRERRHRVARWASTPSFLTESLSTNNGASMDNEREPASPTEVTTEQPRPTNFDSVPSIPSDLF